MTTSKVAKFDLSAASGFSDPGLRAINVLRVASDVVSGTTVTIGDDVIEIEIVNTDTTADTANSDFDNTTSPLTLADYATDYAADAAVAVGDLRRWENEIVRCAASSGNSRTFERGVSGTTIATHADGVNIYKGDGIDPGSTIALGLVTTLTPTAFTAALVDDVNNNGSHPITASLISVNEVLITANEPGALALACAETLGGANNAWANATMYGGRDPAQRRMAIQKRVPKTVEDGVDNMHFVYPFTPTLVQVFVTPTATPGVAKAWDGGVTISGGLVTLDNGGATDWAATDTVTVIAIE